MMAKRLFGQPQAIKKRFSIFQSVISIYSVVCSICFVNLSIHKQKAKPKKNGIKIIDNQCIMI